MTWLISFTIHQIRGKDSYMKINKVLILVLKGCDKLSKKLWVLMREYDERYREKICSQCSPRQREARGCHIVEGKTFCQHMVRARAKYFDKEIKDWLIGVIN